MCDKFHCEVKEFKRCTSSKHLQRFVIHFFRCIFQKHIPFQILCIQLDDLFLISLISKMSGIFTVCAILSAFIFLLEISTVTLTVSDDK